MIKRIFAILLAAGLGMSLLLQNTHAYDNRRDDVELFLYISGLCEEYEIPLAMVLTVIEKESTWNAEAVNYNKTCFGLMQIHKINAGWLEEEHGITDLKDPYQNILAGIIMLAEYWDDYNANPHLMLMCYNFGKPAAKNLWKKKIYSSQYSRWIVGRMGKIEAELEKNAYIEVPPEMTEAGASA